MAFVRVKRIYGSEYAYLVENTWTDKGTRQKVGKYLGKLFRPDKVKSERLTEFLKIPEIRKYIGESNFRKIASDLIMLELQNHNLNEEIKVNFETFSVGKGTKEVVVGINDGFLCNYTLQRLMAYKPEEDYSGYLLADLITAVGIVPEQEVFIELYGKFREKQEAAAAKKFEFYY